MSTAPDSHRGALVDGKYRIVDMLGKGGMATVHRAVNVATGRKVAVKLMAVASDEEPEATAQQVARFKREARLAGTVETQHVVRVYDAGIDGASGAPYIVMELLDGEDLNALIRREGPLRPDLALRVTVQACLGLMKAHEAGVIHRDVKPSNVFLSRDEFGKIVVKLLDFGIAKASETERLDASDSRTLTNTGVMLGSPHYMSPEQVISAKTLDHRTDIWSMGILLFKSLTGRTPHDHHDTVGQLIVSIVSDTPRSSQNFAPWVPPEVDNIVHKALRTRPDDRYPTVHAMLTDMQALLPNGWDITPEMLSPMTDRERGSVRPRRSARPDSKDDAPTVGSGPRKRTDHRSDAPTESTPQPQGAITVDTQSSATTALKGQRRRSALLGAVIAAGAVMALAVWFVNPTRSDAPTPSAPTTATAPVEPTPIASIRPVPATSVEVTISPAGATAELDGHSVDVRDGVMRFAGDLGSVHTLRVRAGDRESTTEIVITATGARPSSVSLIARPVGRPLVRAPAATPRAGGASGAAGTPAAASTPKPPKSTGSAELDHEFK